MKLDLPVKCCFVCGVPFAFQTEAAICIQCKGTPQSIINRITQLEQENAALIHEKTVLREHISQLKQQVEELEDDKDMDALLNKNLMEAAEAIRKDPNWADDAWPAPLERVWFVAMKDRINQLQSALQPIREALERIVKTLESNSYSFHERQCVVQKEYPYYSPHCNCKKLTVLKEAQQALKAINSIYEKH